MRFKDFLLEGDVIRGSFGKGVSLDNVDIPKGYKSFHTKKVGSKDAAQIIGVKSNGDEVVISTTSSSKLADTLVKYYTTGKTDSDIEPVAMSTLVGSNGYTIVKDLGFKFLEKPDYFSYVRSTRGIGETGVAKIKRAFKVYGLELKEYSSEEIYGKHINNDDRLEYTTKNTKWKPEEDIFIIVFSQTNNKYIVDQTGAKSYIRFWLYI